MPKGQDSQKTHSEDVLEQEFAVITDEAALRQWEAINRKAVTESTLPLKLLFDDKWFTLTGERYFLPVTALPTLRGSAIAGEASMYPRDTLYRQLRMVRDVQWDRVREIRRGETVDRYFLMGVLPDGKRTTIDFKVRDNQLTKRLPLAVATKILSTNKPSGTIEKVNDQIWVLGYWEVVFASKGHATDTDDVQLNWEGVCLQIQRGIRVVLHGYYLEVADHGIYPRYIQTPDQPRKVTSWMQFYPYTVTREATEEEFLLFKDRGDSMQREAKRRAESV
jgi:hypothetical protein